MKFQLLLLLLVLVTPNGYAQSLEPKFEELKQVSQLPAKFPQRITALTWDGEKLWAAIYHDNGRYATFNPKNNEWKVDDNEKRLQSIRDVTGRGSSAGGMVFINKKLWFAGAYGDALGIVDTEQWTVEKVFKQKYQNDDSASQSYSDITYDGKNIWIAWHWFKHQLPESQTQLLLKMNPETGAIVSEYSLPRLKAFTNGDGTHGLTWDGKRLWHIRLGQLSAIDPDNGNVVVQYRMKQIKRPSGIVWDGEAFWIIEFEGELWRLPM
ncbi:MAG TPA: hypothetical protein VF648_14710 [Pyrinomonadaceae bacterium]|jgi:hypothetical protein